jgi:dynein assembly factor 3, axonemal
MEIIGHLQLYGLTPCINFFDSSNVDLNADDKPVNVLLSETSDLRHIMKSLSDVLPLNKPRTQPLNIYIHEKNLECIARDLLFLTILCETGMSKRERMELFMDLYGNCNLRDKTDAYL